MPKVTISEQGKRTKESKEFGYLVEIDLTGYSNQEYQNRARLMDGQYLLEERMGINNKSRQFNQFKILKNQNEADKILYKEAKERATKALEGLVPELYDYTQIFKNTSKEKEESEKVKKSKKK